MDDFVFATIVEDLAWRPVVRFAETTVRMVERQGIKRKIVTAAIRAGIAHFHRGPSLQATSGDRLLSGVWSHAFGRAGNAIGRNAKALSLAAVKLCVRLGGLASSAPLRSFWTRDWSHHGEYMTVTVIGVS